MKKALYWLLLATATTVTFPAFSQAPAAPATTATAPGNAVYNWFSSNNISIRKSFDGSKKDEEKPANFFWGRDVKNSFAYTQIDFGLKVAELELFPKKNVIFTVIPKFEWHKDGSNAEKPKNTVSGGINMEFFPGKNKAFWFLGSIDYQTDEVKKLRTWKPKLMASLYKNTVTGWPGSIVRHADGISFLLRYYPYSGLESYFGNSHAAIYWSCRFFLELYPIAFQTKEYLQLTVDYSYRVKLKDDLYNLNNLYWFALGVNIYPDGAGKIGFGLEYNVGDDPANSFTSTEKILFGLKIKL